MCYQQYKNSRKAHCSNSVVKEWAYSNSLSALPWRRGLKQHWRTELKSSVWEQQWHPRMLGNATQALERSIVRITFVRGKRKLGCTITNCFQILSFSPSELLLKLSADTDTILAESYFSLWSAEWAGTLLNLKHGPLPRQVTHFLLLHVWNQCPSGILLHTRLRNRFWLTENCTIFHTNGLVSPLYLSVIPACVAKRNHVFGRM